MAERLAKESTVGEYIPYHFTAATSDQLIAADHGHGTFLGRVTVGTLGTSPVIKLGNGSTATPANVIATITPTAPGTYEFGCVCDKGLFIAITGTSPDVTVMALAMAV
jgi:hypothetical protein